MLMFDKRRAISTIIDRRRHKDGSVDQMTAKPSQMMMAEGGEADPHHEAMRNFMSALQNNDVLKAMEHHKELMKFNSLEDEESKEDASAPEE